MAEAGGGKPRGEKEKERTKNDKGKERAKGHPNGKERKPASKERKGAGKDGKPRRKKGAKKPTEGEIKQLEKLIEPRGILGSFDPRKPRLSKSDKKKIDALIPKYKYTGERECIGQSLKRITADADLITRKIVTDEYLEKLELDMQVWIVQGGIDDIKDVSGRIMLCAIDGTSNSQKAFSEIALPSATEDDCIIILYVLERGQIQKMSTVGSERTRLTRELWLAGLRTIKPHVRACLKQGVRVIALLPQAYDAREQIAEVCNEWNVSHLLMGRHDKKEDTNIYNAGLYMRSTIGYCKASVSRKCTVVVYPDTTSLDGERRPTFAGGAGDSSGVSVDDGAM